MFLNYLWNPEVKFSKMSSFIALFFKKVFIVCQTKNISKLINSGIIGYGQSLENAVNTFLNSILVTHLNNIFTMFLPNFLTPFHWKDFLNIK